MGKRVVIGALLGLAVLSVVGPVFGGAFSVVPQAVRLSESQRSGMVEVRNNAGIETVFQVETFDWVDSPELEKLKPTRSVLAVPAVFRLAPGATQTIRVAARGKSPDDATEQSYRLLISEVPSDEQTGGVVFALRMNLPVFLTPQGAQGALDIGLATDRRNIRLRNSGRAHLRIEELRLVDPTSGRSIETPELQQPAYILPGRTLNVSFAAPSAQGLRVEAQTTAGLFQQSFGE